jgi:putative transposase
MPSFAEPHMRLKPQTYALTAITHGRRSLFQRPVIAEIMIDTLFRYRDAGRFQLHAFVVMPDHIHVLLAPAPDLAIERCAQLIKGGFSFTVRKQFSGEVWQPGYHAHRITDAEDLHNQTLYIANNPMRKHLNAYPYLHTAFSNRLDPPPTLET